MKKVKLLTNQASGRILASQVEEEEVGYREAYTAAEKSSEL